MKVIDTLKQLAGNFSISKNRQEVPDQFCPNCWGRTEYAGNFYDSVNKESKSLGWIQSYYETNLKKIELIKVDDKLICGECKVSYKQKET